jgi:hypothetical protein
LDEHAEITAETGWSHLRTLMPDARLVDTVTDPNLAHLGVGLVIPTNQAEDVATVLAVVDAATTALVSVYTAEAAVSTFRRPAWRSPAFPRRRRARRLGATLCGGTGTLRRLLVVVYTYVEVRLRIL